MAVVLPTTTAAVIMKDLEGYAAPAAELREKVKKIYPSLRFSLPTETEAFRASARKITYRSYEGHTPSFVKTAGGGVFFLEGEEAVEVSENGEGKILLPPGHQHYGLAEWLLNDFSRLYKFHREHYIAPQVSALFRSISVKEGHIRLRDDVYFMPYSAAVAEFIRIVEECSVKEKASYFTVFGVLPESLASVLAKANEQAENLLARYRNALLSNRNPAISKVLWEIAGLKRGLKLLKAVAEELNSHSLAKGAERLLKKLSACYYPSKQAQQTAVR